MSSSQLKDATRNIWKNFVSYISILLITMLSIATYMGVSSASANLENGANDFYRNSNFYDLEIVSTLLLSEDDVNAIVPEDWKFTPCDVNKDGAVNVSDVTALVNMILGITGVDRLYADVTGDGNVNVSDVTSLINFILNQ